MCEKLQWYVKGLNSPAETRCENWRCDNDLLVEEWLVSNLKSDFEVAELICKT